MVIKAQSPAGFAEEYIIESFRWLGIKFDEGVSFGGNHGPYRQSERRGIYKKYVEQLLEAGKAYIAFDTPEQLEAKRAEIQNFQYDAHTRMQMRNSLTLSKEEVDQLIADGKQYTVRFKIEPGQEIHVNDMIRGDVKVMSDILDDKVLYKSHDELPTYHLANIVDDHLMGISHVIRGEEWLPSAPLHVLLYRAFGWEDTMPRFAHLPLLLKPEGKGKLSKRDGDRLGFPVFPLEWEDPKTGEVSTGFRESGYFPEAVVNFLALLGWNPGTEQEMFSLDELVGAFDIGGISKSPAIFDIEKLTYFNANYLRNLPPEEFCKVAEPYIRQAVKNEAYSVGEIAALLQARCEKLTDIPEKVDFFDALPEYGVEFYTNKKSKTNSEVSLDMLNKVLPKLESLPEWTNDAIHDMLVSFAEELGVKNATLMWPLRIAVAGKLVTPGGAVEICHILGREETIKRVKAGIAKLA